MTSRSIHLTRVKKREGEEERERLGERERKREILATLHHGPEKRT